MLYSQQYTTYTSLDNIVNRMFQSFHCNPRSAFCHMTACQEGYCPAQFLSLRKILLPCRDSMKIKCFDNLMSPVQMYHCCWSFCLFLSVYQTMCHLNLCSIRRCNIGNTVCLHKHAVQQQKRSPTTNPNPFFFPDVALQFIFAVILLEYFLIF